MTYTGEEFKDLPKTRCIEASTFTKVAVFAFFVLIRAIHPTIIDASKTITEDGVRTFAYGRQTVNLAEVTVSLAMAQMVAFRKGGLAEWRSIWRPAPFFVFSICGVLYALGDFLEMQSMASLHGGAYQILLQSKLLITAVMAWGIKGTQQTTLQWNILVLVVLSMCVYMSMVDKSEGGGGQKLLGAIVVFLKVFVSCLANVLTEKFMRDYSDEPLYVQAVQLRCARFLTILVMVLMDGETMEKGFFHGWDSCVYAVSLSFSLKAWSTLYLMSCLDVVLKNIGEAVAVLVIYFMEVSLPVFDTTFEFQSFMAVMVVIFSVTAYICTMAADKPKKPQPIKELARDLHALPRGDLDPSPCRRLQTRSRLASCRSGPALASSYP